MPAFDIILIGDDRVKFIPVTECGDNIINLHHASSVLLCDDSDFNKSDKSPALFMVRQSVKDKLEQAQSLLPQGFRFLIKECYRPLEMQENSFRKYSEKLQKENPGWTADRVYQECCKLVAPVEVAPHSTGGAVDLTILDADGNVLDMGTEYDAEPILTDNATYTLAKNINESAQLNRAMLVKVMTEVGFVNYPTEWWHWSFGDKYWAFMINAPAAIFSTQKTNG